MPIRTVENEHAWIANSGKSHDGVIVNAARAGLVDDDGPCGS